jgi:XTP/dITP diphosphohydrolase
MSKMNKTIVLASGNSGKLREFQSLLSDCGMTVQPQSAFNLREVAETGLSFVENAIIKARHACKHTGLAAIADDSGLEVDALQGQPGIYSSRFSGDNANDQRNNQHLLQLLQETPEPQRTARFQCLLVFMRHEKDPTPIICQGTWQGKILSAPSGDKGFGYDPLFYIPSKGCSAAELDPTDKNQLSHRGQAMAKLLQALSAIKM